MSNVDWTHWVIFVDLPLRMHSENNKNKGWWVWEGVGRRKSCRDQREGVNDGNTVLIYKVLKKNKTNILEACELGQMIPLNYLCSLLNNYFWIINTICYVFDTCTRFILGYQIKCEADSPGELCPSGTEGSKADARGKPGDQGQVVPREGMGKGA